MKQCELAWLWMELGQEGREVTVPFPDHSRYVHKHTVLKSNTAGTCTSFLVSSPGPGFSRVWL